MSTNTTTPHQQLGQHAQVGDFHIEIVGIGPREWRWEVLQVRAGARVHGTERTLEAAKSAAMTAGNVTDRESVNWLPIGPAVPIE